MKKKFLASIAAATALALSMSTVAFAADTSATVEEDEDEVAISVPVEIIAAEELVAINVEIDWEDLTFSYEIEDATWNGEEYTEVKGSWEEEEVSIIVSNYSNVPVSISGEFENEADEEAVADIEVTVAETKIPCVLDDGDPEYEEVELAVKITGEPAGNVDFSGALGTLTLTIASASE